MTISRARPAGAAENRWRGVIKNLPTSKNVFGIESFNRRLRSLITEFGGGGECRCVRVYYIIHEENVFRKYAE